MPDSKPDAPIFLADMIVDRAQAIMPAMAAALLDPDLAGGKIQVVETEADRSIAEVLPNFRKGNIQKEDHVSTRLQ